MVCLALIFVCLIKTLELVLHGIKSNNQVTIMEQIKLNFNLI